MGADKMVTSRDRNIHAWTDNQCDCHVDLRCDVISTSEAIRLVELGARAGLVSHLTGLKKASVNRLYRQIHGIPSPPGQNIYSDSWYLLQQKRMLHASVVWRLNRQLDDTAGSPARRLINLFELYMTVVRKPLLDISRVQFIPRLVEMHTWIERLCRDCRCSYVYPVARLSRLCPGCSLYQRYRCHFCGAPFPGHVTGRRHESCYQCGATQCH